MKPSIKIDLALILVLLVAMVGVSIHYRSQQSTEESLFSPERITGQRLEALQLAIPYNGTRFPEVVGRDAVTNETHQTTFSGSTVAVALTRAGCSPCQIRELRNLDTLHHRLQGQVSVLALFYDEMNSGKNASRQQALMLRKTAQPAYPIWYTMDDRFGKYMARGSFPMIFLLHDQTVVSSFAAVPSDDEFSSGFMRVLHQVLAGPLLEAPQLPEDDVPDTSVQLEEAWSLRALTGETIDLEDLRGRVVLLNRWATWCAPCIAELQTLEALYQTVPEEDVAVLLVSEEEEETIRSFIKAGEYALPVFVQESSPPALLSVSSPKIG